MPTPDPGYEAYRARREQLAEQLSAELGTSTEHLLTLRTTDGRTHRVLVLGWDDPVNRERRAWS